MFGYNTQFVIVAAALAVIGARGLSHLTHLPASAQKPVVAAAAPRGTESSKVSMAASTHSSYGEEHLSPDRNGQFSSNVEINGARVHMLVDTGASSVALSYEDAAAIGVLPAPSDYKYAVSTANGVGRVARVHLRQVRLGFLVVENVEALIGERGALQTSLLGMTFLSKLHVEMGSGGLNLRY